MPRLVIMNADADTAGCGIALKRAFDKHAPGWEARAICRAKNYLDYPTDILWPYNEHGAIARQVSDLVSAADVIHIMDNESPLFLFGPQRLKGKRVVMQYLGTHYRRNRRAAERRSRAFHAVQCTDSIDLVSDAVPFLSRAADLDAIAAYRNGYQPGERIRIGAAPTKRTVSSTDQVIPIVQALAKRYPIDFDLIEGVSNEECLRRKAKLDIFIDRFTLGPGVNDMECAAMGVAMVVGLEGEAIRKRAASMWGEWPWADATIRTLPQVLERLVCDPAWRAELVERGRQWVWAWHSEQAVVKQALRMYGYPS